MTIVSEKTSRDKYSYLKFIEFLELVCRAAQDISTFNSDMEGTVNASPVYQNVHWLLQQISERHGLLGDVTSLVSPDAEEELQRKEQIDLVKEMSKVSNKAFTLDSEEGKKMFKKMSTKMLTLIK